MSLNLFIIRRNGFINESLRYVNVDTGSSSSRLIAFSGSFIEIIESEISIKLGISGLINSAEVIERECNFRRNEVI